MASDNVKGARGMRLADLELHDGHTAKEKRVHQLLVQADVDGDGILTSKELIGVFCNLDETKVKESRMAMLTMLLGLGLVLALASVFGVAFAAGEALKEMHVTNGRLAALDGNSVRVSIDRESKYLFDVPSLTAQELRRIKQADVHIETALGDHSESAVGTIWRSASFEVAGYARESIDVVDLYTRVSSVVIRVDGASRTATITMPNGVTSAVIGTLPSSSAQYQEEAQRRRLSRKRKGIAGNTDVQLDECHAGPEFGC